MSEVALVMAAGRPADAALPVASPADGLASPGPFAAVLQAAGGRRPDAAIPGESADAESRGLREPASDAGALEALALALLMPHPGPGVAPVPLPTDPARQPAAGLVVATSRTPWSRPADGGQEAAASTGGAPRGRESAGGPQAEPSTGRDRILAEGPRARAAPLAPLAGEPAVAGGRPEVTEHRAPAADREASIPARGHPSVLEEGVPDVAGPGPGIPAIPLAGIDPPGASVVPVVDATDAEGTGRGAASEPGIAPAAPAAGTAQPASGVGAARGQDVTSGEAADSGAAVARGEAPGRGEAAGNGVASPRGEAGSGAVVREGHAGLTPPPDRVEREPRAGVAAAVEMRVRPAGPGVASARESGPAPAAPAEVAARGLAPRGSMPDATVLAAPAHPGPDVRAVAGPASLDLASGHDGGGDEPDDPPETPGSVGLARAVPAGAEAVVSMSERAAGPTAAAPPVIDQVLGAVRAAIRTGRRETSGERHEVTLRLDPPELGQLRLRAVLDGERLSLHFIVEGEPARQALSQAVPALREALGHQGLVAGHVAVDVGAGGANGGAPGDARWSAPLAGVMSPPASRWAASPGGGGREPHEGTIDVWA